MQDEKCCQETEEEEGVITGNVWSSKTFLRCSSNCSLSFADARSDWKAGKKEHFVTICYVITNTGKKNSVVHIVFAAEPEGNNSYRPAWHLIQTPPRFGSTDSVTLPVVSSHCGALLVHSHSSCYWHTPTIFTNIVTPTQSAKTLILMSIHCVADQHWSTIDGVLWPIWGTSRNSQNIFLKLKSLTAT